MEPSTKRRKLAPKVPSASDPKPQPAQHPHDPPPPPPQHYPVQEPAIIERHDFESFARHLQDAAMLIQRQTERPQYSDVSVLMLKWEGDDAVEEDLTTLEALLRTNYHFHTERWQIPSCPNPSVKLGVQIASFLDNPKPDHLLIIYYAGHGYVGSDGQLYWASNDREDAAKLKWGGVRCLFEDAQSDMLLFLDTCAAPDPAPSGNHGVKQAIAACTPDYDSRHGSGRSFTSFLSEALHRLGSGRPFTAQKLYEEVLSLQQQHLRQANHSPMVNGSKPRAQMPLFFPVTPGKGQSLTLAPVSAKPTVAPPPNGADPHAQHARDREEKLLDPSAVADIKFDDARVLVCTTFVGDASPDMSFFHQWLQNTPPLGAKIAVEGMFLGPPTMLLISMPHSVWNVVQHDKVCCFLGYITSHNMLHLYEKLIGPSGAKPSPKHVDEGRILLEAREMAAAPTPPTIRDRDRDREPVRDREREPQRERDPRDLPPPPPPIPTEAVVPRSSGFVAHNAPAKRPFPPASPGSASGKPKEENEGSAEMREAAEQLKALSHVRHRSDETPHATGRQRTSLPNGIPLNDSPPPRESYEVGPDSPSSPDKAKSVAPRVKVPRHALPKNETRCSHCSHAPFRDSSSLRKHIAAAHTRPFPCAFAFAGCNSTFGSKNEWKRHITSQHLCLQYYRCSACPQSAIEGKGNEFNRKDLFTQHLRRMHAPFQLKRPAAKGDAKIQADWDIQVKSMQQSCLVNRRYPPQKSACPNPDCRNVFEGPTAWDEWTEHVGRHMEKGEGHKLDVDRLLVKWALEEGIIEPKPGGDGYRLCYATQNSTSSGGEERSYVERDPAPHSVTEQLHHSRDHSRVSSMHKEPRELSEIRVATAVPLKDVEMDIDK